MALADFLTDLDAFESDAAAAFGNAGDTTALEAARVEFLGAKAGRLKAIQKGLGGLQKADKPAGGQKLNAVKTAVETAFMAAQERLASGAKSVERAAFDITLPGRPLRRGRLHPITQTIERMKEIMGRLGFTAVEGPEIEDDWHNFVALNIPEIHPARDPLDNFYLSVGSHLAPGESPGAKYEGTPALGPDGKPLLLRSQTSTVQIRTMEEAVASADGGTPPPVRIVSLGRVYRPDTADATHYPMFHQIEGLCIAPGVTMADLKGVLQMFWQSYFGLESNEPIEVRFRPSFFPFTEPSVECDIWHDGKWMEIGGAGMVDPNVLRAVGYDPEEVTGFAFGLGIERICMRQHGITDIRDLYANDVRFLAQF
ncbi:phenylalanine--tRNA ligase subunit alpha [Botrimarina mediterranea]|uniref:Phenylalanine--tRNA ligase alpha subunit n=1 Tax=Botrimarina mediterranea TaxID=2528022 RepID=A0A518K3Q9_9BACT|nr:phenylalanine--tRNA ligase subunit alpha [Botrimarina mediterranea]QDV72405.1 Phenylalanine--tRNA ligase alpha subunit [Botrimarina mediterranea]QDV76951.1 Phenylalanine--tRNA ligase alpha subunit [Planctomycetes bacterium K2D]